MEVLCGHLVGKFLLCRMSLVDYFSKNTQTSLMIRFEKESLELNSLPTTCITLHDHAKSVIRVTEYGLDQNIYKPSRAISQPSQLCSRSQL